MYKGKESRFTDGEHAADHMYQLKKLLEKCNRQPKEVSLIFYHLEKT